MRAGVLAVLLVGCADTGYCVDGEHLAITQGVYGQVTYMSDVHPSSPGPSPNVVVWTVDSAAARTEATSDAQGAFAIELAVGDYELRSLDYPPTCDLDHCIRLRIGSGDVVRADLHTSYGSSWALADPGCD